MTKLRKQIRKEDCYVKKKEDVQFLFFKFNNWDNYIAIDMRCNKLFRGGRGWIETNQYIKENGGS